LKSSDSTRWGAANSWSVLARDRITDSLSESSFLPKEPPTRCRPARGPAVSRTGYQTNSSTFGTLLSSQGSSAHHSQASRPSRWGNLSKLTGSLARGQIRIRARSPAQPPAVEPARGCVAAYPNHLDGGEKSEGLASGRPPGSQPCVPPLRGDEAKH
jgi:hypothetical protein